MSFLKYFLGEKKSTASVAKERLQLILAHERNGRKPSADYLPQLKNELLAVISKYIDIDMKDINVDVQHHGDMDVLELKIELPEGR
ncbi:cell division topological specificity factor MinE [Paucibacter aquatile]|jgi:cell division topological specificity factor|uniref:Cell division topological specificity factor n=1 Tax=Kinneretia aquatilis TaxID=2070761 RepID=A0A2N8KRK1_9BURK|nr:MULTISPECIES: cell division topological specificity factor MinE [Roseateles]MCV2423351.1 cell division topological specificity factor MinE [Paucibacter sp. DJ4R-1]MCZ8076390.1 cell division topological specificity factor MinE [Roseateles sp.]OYU27160.1 MAG: cell division topological specificity factor MinE [Burkholderiales bacterium PBB2]MCV2364308.1 cell division topological specificity factor MinE [Paucibacter sp. DJ1R-11]MCV2438546.1 cell division topological specificity factor MinE [Pau